MRKRKQHHEEHENLERWLISYADFVTLLFAFFVVMYAISSVNEGKYRVLSESLVSAFKTVPINNPTKPTHPQMIPRPQVMPNNPSEAMVAKPDLIKKPDRQTQQRTENMRQIAQNLMQVLAPLIKDNQVKLTQSLRGITVEINAAVLFAPGQATLETESIKALTEVAKVLSDVPNQIQIEGHTDDTPISTPYYPSNWELSSARASSVVRLFAANDVAPERLVAIGYADNRPVTPNTDATSRARNRRVTMLIISEAPNKSTEIPLQQKPEPAPTPTPAR